MFKLEIQPSTVLNTEWGTAQVNNKGYYQIVNRKDGNKGKLLHRLIWEREYGELSPQTHLHHIDGNALNNCIWNLEPMSASEHHKLHKFGKNRSEETKEKISKSLIGFEHSDESIFKMSKSKNTTGYFRVYKHKNPKLKQGFDWSYSWYENGKRKAITRVNLDELEKEVKNRGLEWKVIKND